jgi:hypothetical protein
MIHYNGPTDFAFTLDQEKDLTPVKPGPDNANKGLSC